MKRKIPKLSRTQLLLLTSAVTLLPMLVGLVLYLFRLPDQFAIYLDSDNRPDAWGNMLNTIFISPLCMLAGHWILYFITTRDPGNKDQSPKIFSLTLWILPILSNLTSYMTFALAMGAHYPVMAYIQILLGLLFACIGNYLPKTRPNATIGIRIPWVYTSRHNWNATHRFGGKCWMVGGLMMILTAFVPSNYSEEIMSGLILILVLLPVAFSYTYYLRQKAKGEPLHSLRDLSKGGLVTLAVVLIFVAVILLTGNIDYVFHQDHMTIEASYYSDYVVFYDNIQAVEYRDGHAEGSRIGGYGSLRLLMGYFHNDELETYTRYTYFRPGAHILLTLHDRPLVISAKNKAETRQLYEQLLSRIQNQTP